MSTVAEINATLPKLNNQELRQVEEAVRQLYRQRHGSVLYDDLYGNWTEDDQTSAAGEAFALLDQAEACHEQPRTR